MLLVTSLLPPPQRMSLYSTPKLSGSLEILVYLARAGNLHNASQTQDSVEHNENNDSSNPQDHAIPHTGLTVFT